MHTFKNEFTRKGSQILETFKQLYWNDVFFICMNLLSIRIVINYLEIINQVATREICKMREQKVLDKLDASCIL